MQLAITLAQVILIAWVAFYLLNLVIKRWRKKDEERRSANAAESMITPEQKRETEAMLEAIAALKARADKAARERGVHA